MDIKKYREWMEEEKPTEAELLEEAKLSPYWKKRARARAKNAGRPLRNGADRKWALEQQEKSSSINKRLHKIFEKELSENEELSEEITAFLERVKKKREEQKALEEEKRKAKLEKPTGKRGKKTLPNPYAGEKITKKFPYGGGRDGGVAKVYRKRMKKAGGGALAPGEAFGSIGEGLTEAPVKIGSGKNAPRPSQVKDMMKMLGMMPSSASSNTQKQQPAANRDVQKELNELTPIQQHNFYKLLEDVPTYSHEDLTAEAPQQLLSKFGMDMSDLIDLLNSCDTLMKVKIENPLFAGTQGLTYTLENGRLIKLFVGGYQDDLDWFSGLTQKMYDSNGSIMELPVFDSGQTKAKAATGRYVKFSEVAKLLDFGSFLKQTGRKKANGNVDMSNISYAVFSVYNSKDDQETFLLKMFSYMRNERLKRLAMTKPEAIQAAIMIKHFLERGNQLNDFHAGNVAVIPQSDLANKPIFVVIDN